MKLVFYDGIVNDRPKYHQELLNVVEKYFYNLGCENYCHRVIDAGFGISRVLRAFEDCVNTFDNSIILTNSTDLLNYVEHKNDIYLVLVDDYNNFIIKPLQECCDKELRDCHDIRKLYLSGVFSEVYQLTNKKEGL